jgi:hypothetical protein
MNVEDIFTPDHIALVVDNGFGLSFLFQNGLFVGLGAGN